MAAMQLAELTPGASVLDVRCKKCDSPLIEYPKQNIAICGYCSAKNEREVQDRRLLVTIMRLHAMQAMAKQAPQPKIESPKKRDLSMYEPSYTIGDLLSWMERHKEYLSRLRDEEIAKKALDLGFSARDVAIWKLRRPGKKAA